MQASHNPGQPERGAAPDTSPIHQVIARARQAGLGTTVHTGETTHTGPDGVLAVIDKLKPAPYPAPPAYPAPAPCWRWFPTTC